MGHRCRSNFLKLYWEVVSVLVTQWVRFLTFLFEHSVYFCRMNVENEYLSNGGVVLCRNSAHGSDHRYSVVSTSVMIQGLGRLCSCGWRSLGGNWHSAPCAVKYWARQSGAEELRSSSLVLLNSKVLLHTLRSSFLNSCCYESWKLHLNITAWRVT